MAFNKYITFIICLVIFSNCSPKVRNNLATHKKLDQSQIDKIKKLTYQALNNQDCVQLREYLTSLFFNLNCATKFESEYIKVRDSIENYFKKEKLLKKRNVNNCIFFENYFDAVCISIKYAGFSKQELTREILKDIHAKKQYSTNFQPERILIGHSLSLLDVDEVAMFFNMQDKETKNELIASFAFSDDYTQYCKRILETEQDEKIIFYLNAILNENENRVMKDERNRFLNKSN